MPTNIFDGLALVDSMGRLILGATVLSLILAIAANLFVRARYRKLDRDLQDNGASHRRFDHAVLNDIARDAEAAARRASEPNAQAIIEEHFQAQLGPLLRAERFVRAATGLVIILGLLGTFYGLTLSIGKLVHLVADDPSKVSDVAQAVSTGLTQALSGMAVAFSNSLLGILSAVILTVLGVFSNLTDQRVALMIRIETYLDRRLSDPALAHSSATPTGFGASVERLERVVERFDAALQAFSSSTRDFTEFNAHLKDNVQRMSLSFGDLSETLKHEIVALKRNGRGGGA